MFYLYFQFFSIFVLQSEMINWIKIGSITRFCLDTKQSFLILFKVQIKVDFELNKNIVTKTVKKKIDERKKRLYIVYFFFDKVKAFLATEFGMVSVIFFRKIRFMKNIKIKENTHFWCKSNVWSKYFFILFAFKLYFYRLIFSHFFNLIIFYEKKFFLISAHSTILIVIWFGRFINLFILKLY